MKYGDLGKRIVAHIIDGVIITLICMLFIYLFSFAGAVISLFVSLVYFIAMEGSSVHATVGKIAMNMYVGDSHGSGISYSQAILRYIGKALSNLTFGIGYLIGFFSENKQCLHDMLAKTYVYEGRPKIRGMGIVGGAPELICVNGPLAGKCYEITERGLLIGRDGVSCRVVLPERFANVSRIHCYVTYNPFSGMFVLTDRGSTYGTYTSDGVRIPKGGSVALKRGERFYIVNKNIIFEVR